jgi:hypothetical protein
MRETYCDKFYYQNIATKEIVSLPSPNIQNLPKGNWMYIGKNDEVKLKVEDYERNGWNMNIKKECDKLNG